MPLWKFVTRLFTHHTSSLIKNGFIKFDSPILSGNAAEDSTELFETDYFGEPTFLTQSGQLYLEAGAMAFGRVFDFGPVFRAENLKLVVI